MWNYDLTNEKYGISKRSALNKGIKNGKKPEGLLSKNEGLTSYS
jgi:hypothetical protein